MTHLCKPLSQSYWLAIFLSTTLRCEFSENIIFPDLLFIAYIILWRCFPHIVNLACQAVLKSITDMDFDTEDATDYVPAAAGCEWGPIAMVCTVVRVVSIFMSSPSHYHVNFTFLGPCVISASWSICWGLQNVEPEGASAIQRHLWSMVINISNGWTCICSDEGTCAFQLKGEFSLVIERSLICFFHRTVICRSIS